MTRLVIPHTAFPLSHGDKRPREEAKDHLAFIRGLPCCVCGTTRNVEAAHIRMGNLKYGKPETPLGKKPSDCWTVPLCAYDHRLAPHSQHAVGEHNFWQPPRVDPFVLALALWRATGDQAAGELIVSEMRR